MIRFDLVHTPIDQQAILLSVADAAGGGINLFLGIVRNHNDGKVVQSLSYEAYESMAKSVCDEILREASQTFDILHAFAQHRVGDLNIGDVAVAVAVCAAHRDAAYKACRSIIDRIKTDAPIWKKEYYDVGEKWVACSCVENPP